MLRCACGSWDRAAPTQPSHPPPPADELIRHVAINQPERGLLLLRVRDEIRMTIDAYKTLYESSVTFGVRKQLQAEQGMSELEGEVRPAPCPSQAGQRDGALTAPPPPNHQIEELESKKKELENQVLELRNKVDVVEKREAERRQLEEKRRKEEIEFLKYQGQHFDQFLKSIGGGK